MKNIKIIKYFISFVIIIGIINILLFLACSFNSNIIRNNVIKSSKILNKEGSFYHVKDISKVENNNLTDAQIINEAISIDNKHPIISYMKMRRNYDSKITLIEKEDINGDGLTMGFDKNSNTETLGGSYDTISELHYFLNKKIHTSIDNGRYWHGYIILYRPLLILFDISQIRLLLLVCFIVLFIIFLYLIFNRFDIIKVIIFGSSLVFTNYISASYSLESAPVFLIMMISSIYLLLRLDKIKSFGLFIFIVGCITNIFDYLTVPLITLGVLCSIYVLKLYQDKKDWKYCIKFVILNSLIWLIGYACTWLFKWILFDLIIHGNNSMVKIGIEQCLFRIQHTSKTIYSGFSVWDRIAEFMNSMPLYLLGTLMLIVILKKFNYNINIKDKRYIVFLLIAFMPIVWYIVLSNHTIIHYRFVHRHMLLFMMGVLLAINEILFAKDKKGS